MNETIWLAGIMRLCERSEGEVRGQNKRRGVGFGLRRKQRVIGTGMIKVCCGRLEAVGLSKGHVIPNRNGGEGMFGNVRIGEREGEVILSQEPYVCVPNNSSTVSRCDGCFASESLKKCSACQVVWYCGSTCQKSEWKLHRLECNALSRLEKEKRKSVTPSIRLMVRLYLRRKLQNEMIAHQLLFLAYVLTIFDCFDCQAIPTSVTDNYNLVEALVSHIKDLDEKQLVLYAQMANLVHWILQWPEINIKEIAENFSKLACNAHTICDCELRPLGTGIYPVVSIINHSCLPNAVLIFEGRLAVIRAVEHIPKGAEVRVELHIISIFIVSSGSVLDSVHKVPRPFEVSIAYIETAGSTMTRQKALKEQHTPSLPADNTYVLLKGQYVDIQESAILEGYRCKDDRCNGFLLLDSGVYPELHPLLGLQYYTCGKIEWLLGDTEDSIKSLTRAVEILRITHGTNSPFMKELMMKLDEARAEASYNLSSKDEARNKNVAEQVFDMFVELLQNLVCQKCGDRGYPEALNYCVMCEVVAEHSYCLDVVPKDLDKDLVWTCWFCSSGNDGGHDTLDSYTQLSTSDQAVKFVSKQEQKASDAYLKGVKKAERIKRGRSLQSDEVEADKRVCLTNSTDREADKRVCLTKSTDRELDCSQLQEENKRTLFHGESSDEHQKSSEHGMLIAEDRGGANEEVLTVEKEASQNGKSDLPKISDHDANLNVQPFEENENTLSGGESCAQDQNLSEQNRLILDVGGGSNEVVNCSEKETSHNGTGDLPEILDQDFNTNAEPILDPIWRGGFTINNGNFEVMNGLVAYTSNQASPKVRETASLLPGLVSIEMLPRLEVFPKRFATTVVTAGDIGLYIFPEKERDERAFDELLDSIIEQDLALKAVLENAELLLFTSLQLPLHNWRYRGKYYLWGLFSRRKSCRLNRREHVTA
ncbi:unnamed protein product [Dovyalis caffra]|uniref:Uncharacterized protein n=1 Tax=Dovyalis caffra TaxID=77055 RepID=A0AAV1S6W6_9ROSI|nr:unnamed protein product [Dovyalis caffra]